jgi:hypothetical protein
VPTDELRAGVPISARIGYGDYDECVHSPEHNPTETAAPTERRRASRRAATARALTECRVALAAYAAAENPVGAVQEFVRSFALLARREELPPERVLAMFKSMVHGVIKTGDRHVGERAEIMRALVKVAIDAYYEDGEVRTRR